MIMLKLYSTGCPTCNSIKKLLKDKNVGYEEITDNDEIMAMADRFQIDNVPFAITDSGDILNSSVEIFDYIDGRK